MNLSDTNLRAGNRHESGSVLIIVLWIAIGLISITLYFANSMSLELHASDNRTSGLAADQAIEGAARYVSYALTIYATNGVVPTNNQFACEAVAVGDSHFWVIGRDPSGTPATDPYFGLVDEGSKLNLNKVGTNALAYLPNMTTDFAGAIADWRGTNSMMSLDYTSLGYESKQAPFETVDELRLVYGASIDLLVGDDANRNGILDGSEKSSTGGTTPTYGLMEYTTVYSREPNFHSDGTTLTNVNNASQSEMTALFQGAGVSGANNLARSIYNTIHPQTGPARPLAGVFTLCVDCMSAGMSAYDFSKIYNSVTTTTNQYTYGRININTASEPVLASLFVGLGVDQSTAESAAQTLVTYRQQNSDSLYSVAWLVSALGQTHQVVRALANRDLVTTKSFQFTADIAAVGPYGRGYRRVKFIFDTTDGTPKILYRQDLSRLGWALGQKARETWVAKSTT